MEEIMRCESLDVKGICGEWCQDCKYTLCEYNGNKKIKKSYYDGRVTKEQRKLLNNKEYYCYNIKDLARLYGSVNAVHKKFEELGLITKFGKHWVLNKWSEMPNYGCKDWLTQLWITPGGSDGYYGKQSLIFIDNRIVDQLEEGSTIEEVIDSYWKDKQEEMAQMKEIMKEKDNTVFERAKSLMKNGKLSLKLFSEEFAEEENAEEVHRVLNWFIRKGLII